jgi:hypothetical protein
LLWFWDFRNASLSDVIKSPDDFKVIFPLDKVIGLIRDGQFTVGHIEYTSRSVSLLINFTNLFCIRNIRDSLVSPMRFITDKRRKVQPKANWVDEDDNALRLLGYLRVQGQNFINGVLPQIQWATEKNNVLICRYEEAMGDYGEDVQRVFFERLADFLEINRGIDIIRIFKEQVVGHETRTYSGSRSNHATYWNDDVEEEFHKIGAYRVNVELGYD